MRQLMGAAAVCVVLGIGPGCSSDPEEGTFPCVTDTECPATWVCRADNRCWRTPADGDADLPDGGRDASTADVPGLDAPMSMMDVPEGVDAGGDDAGGDDAGLDAPASMDAPDSPGLDAPGADVALFDGGSDAGVDAGTDAGNDGGTDAGTDAGRDAGTDAGGPCGGLPMSTFYRDLDGDTYGAAASGMMMRCAAGGGFVASNTDCDDSNSGRHPGAAEVCNGLDDNCDSVVDGATADASCSVAHGVGLCDLGFCAVGSCDSNFGNCDALDANGCESDTRIDGRNCGGCGLGCLVADSCSASSCDGSPIVQISAGFTAICARRANGRVACWGTIGGATLRVPTQLEGVVDAIDVDVGANLACVVHAGGTVSCFSNPASGAALVAGIVDAADVAVANDTPCALRTNGRIACWGRRSGYPAGTPGTGDSVSAVPISGVTDAVQLEGSHTTLYGAFVARRATGAVVWWSGGGALAGPTIAISSAVDVTVGTSYIAGGAFYCALLSGGDVRCWGGVSGPPWGVAFSDTGPAVMTGVAEIEAVSSTNAYGEAGLCGATAAGAVYCVGSDGFGQLGLGGPYDVRYTTPTLSPSLSGIGSLSSFDKGACALNASGTAVRCWGWGNGYEIGIGAVPSGPGGTARTPALVLGL